MQIITTNERYIVLWKHTFDDKNNKKKKVDRKSRKVNKGKFYFKVNNNSLTIVIEIIKK